MSATAEVVNLLQHLVRDEGVSDGTDGSGSTGRRPWRWPSDASCSAFRPGGTLVIFGVADEEAVDREGPGPVAESPGEGFATDHCLTDADPARFHVDERIDTRSLDLSLELWEWSRRGFLA